MKPILFNTEMVKAILDGRKTVTRRVVKEKGWDITGQPKWANGEFWFNVCMKNKEENAKTATCHLLKPPYVAGDILYVRETWRVRNVYGDFTRQDRVAEIEFKAGGKNSYMNIYEDSVYSKAWRPSIHMPKDAARIFLRVTDVRIERLQDIDCEDARKEGCDGRCDVPSNGAEGVLSCITRDFSLEKFQSVWDSTIKPSDICKYGWNANPYVWVIDFEQCDKPEE